MHLSPEIILAFSKELLNVKESLRNSFQYYRFGGCYSTETFQRTRNLTLQTSHPTKEEKVWSSPLGQLTSLRKPVSLVFQTNYSRLLSIILKSKSQAEFHSFQEGFMHEKQYFQKQRRTEDPNHMRFESTAAKMPVLHAFDPLAQTNVILHTFHRVRSQ